MAETLGVYIEKKITLSAGSTLKLKSYDSIVLITSHGSSFNGTVLLSASYGKAIVEIFNNTIGRVGTTGTMLLLSKLDNSNWDNLIITNVSDSDIIFGLLRINMKGI